jgi:four helix bundle protein
MNADLIISRTKKFAIDNIKFFQRLPKSEEAKIIGKQLLRSSTSVASNYLLLAGQGQDRSSTQRFAL